MYLEIRVGISKEILFNDLCFNDTVSNTYIINK